MSSQYSDSGSDSDNDAPEQVSLSTARQGRLHQDRQNELQLQAAAQAKKAKNKAADAKRKQAAKGKAKVFEQDDEDAEEIEDEEEEERQEQPTAPTASSSKINYLDESLFASAAAHYEPEQQPEAGKGKMAAKRLARMERQARNAAAAERAAQIGEGGARDVGNLTLQHLATPSHTSHSLASTSLPSHTSATKFLTNRLYSKKRQLAVLDAGKPRTSEESGRKRKKKGGMSAESRALLGMGIDDGAKDKEDAEEKERNRKRSLLLQAEGKRKSASLARPLASARSKGKPASQFAVSTRTR